MATTKTTTKKAATKKVVYYYGTGRRKTSIARVFMKRGKGVLTINGRSLEDYFPRETARMVVLQPLEAVGMLGKMDFKITVEGGGLSGQSGAIRLGIARALVQYDEEEIVPKKVSKKAKAADATAEAEVDAEPQTVKIEGVLSFRRIFRSKGYLTRDARIVERKKVGLHKARRAPQYSKR